MWWAAGSPNAVEPLAEIMKLPNNLTIDCLTYMVSDFGVLNELTLLLNAARV